MKFPWGAALQYGALSVKCPQHIFGEFASASGCFCVVCRAYRKTGYLTMAIAGYIPANSQLAAAIATIVKSLSIGK